MNILPVEAITLSQAAKPCSLSNAAAAAQDSYPLANSFQCATVFVGACGCAMVCPSKLEQLQQNC